MERAVHLFDGQVVEKENGKKMPPTAVSARTHFPPKVRELGVGFIELGREFVISMLGDVLGYGTSI